MASPGHFFISLIPPPENVRDGDSMAALLLPGKLRGVAQLPPYSLAIAPQILKEMT
jgi:hypothetical protein